MYAQEAFAKYVDVNSVAESLAAPKAARLTPKALMHSITQKCQANPQHIVLPEVIITFPEFHLVLTLDGNPALSTVLGADLDLWSKT